MPIQYARSLTSQQGSSRTIRHLGFTLAFIAGAANAGAYLAVQIYTSHMTGIVSSLADHPDYVGAAARLPRGIRWLDLADGMMKSPGHKTVRTRV